MIYRALAELTLATHAVFIAFVVIGGFLAIRVRRVAWFHIPCAIWGALIEFAGWTCPLTPLENVLRRAGGEAGYNEGFIERYLLPLIYPGDLTRELQFLLGALAVGLNLIAYWLVFRRGAKTQASTESRLF
jgi:hypothetical protein|tara:strand:- start:754 stop:1146 length:393 start_codon:yes stop_codon:yes gene_type:complete